MDTLVAAGDTPAGAAGILDGAVDIPAGAADTRRRRVDTLPEAEAGSHRRLALDSTGAALTLLKLFLKKKQKQCSKNNLSRKACTIRTRVPTSLFTTLPISVGDP